jgi:S-adenosylmethionine decarboxylase
VLKSFYAFIVLCFILAGDLDAKDSYSFTGKHLIASYKQCDHNALINMTSLSDAMKKAVIASGATILDSSEVEFSNNGFTMVILLSESHATIHTYPEYNACFVDIFTCGNICDVEHFDEVLQEYLKPVVADIKIEKRS